MPKIFIISKSFKLNLSYFLFFYIIVENVKSSKATWQKLWGNNNFPHLVGAMKRYWNVFCRIPATDMYSSTIDVPWHLVIYINQRQDMYHANEKY
ncbi:unnamed protein product [Arabidopsis halleri]